MGVKVSSQIATSQRHKRRVNKMTLHSLATRCDPTTSMTNIYQHLTIHIRTYTEEAEDDLGEAAIDSQHGLFLHLPQEPRPHHPQAHVSQVRSGCQAAC